MSLHALTFALRKHAPFLQPKTHVQQVMLEVSLALLPVFAALTYFYGSGILINAAIAGLGCMLIEAACLALQRKALKPGVSDGSALLTGLLIAACLPPACPAWVTLIACVIAVGIAKQLFGGLGRNVFNPAMAGYAFVLLSFPTYFSAWPLSHGVALDALSEATVLSTTQTQLAMQWTLEEIKSAPSWASTSLASIVISLAALLGGLAIWLRGHIRWIIPVSVIAGMAMMLTLIKLTTVQPLLGLEQLLYGGVLFTAFFIATDPVTSPTGKRAQWTYGFMLGSFIILGRQFGVYPDAAALSVLLANALAPWIEHLSNPKRIGQQT